MSTIYDNWERLVASVLKKEQLWKLFHDHSRTPSICSEESDLTSSSYLSSPLYDVVFDFSSSPNYWQRTYEELGKSREGVPKLILISEFNPSVDVEDLFVAYLQLLGRGTFGSVYTAVMENGARIVLKRLKPGIVSEPEFKRKMEIVENVRHKNIVSSRAFYSFGDERFVLYDYHSKGSMHTLLHGKFGGNLACVDWETRLRIAIGAARGLAEIHAQYGGKLVHGNIKASNVLLNSERYGCISDLGMMTSSLSNNEVSQASDVHSFGILLLELLSRKSPVNVDLVKLVTSLRSKEWVAEVFDAGLLNSPILKQQMIKVLQIGMSCFTKSPKRRPKMSDVVKMLEDVNIMSINDHSFLKTKLVLLEDGDSRFTVEDMWNATATVLERGLFGSLYKIVLKNRNLIMVEGFWRDVNVKFKEFQQHMEVIGRIRHKNVAELRAYYFSNYAKVLLYDYYNQESLSALLHGAGRKRLNWESRLKIAVGAARGISHIHRQNGSNLVHGNIKSSKIFMNAQQYGLLADTGLAKLYNPIKLSAMKNSGYCAPEVIETKKVSQASDVYSFGVVLLELVSGKTSQHIMLDVKAISLVNRFQSSLEEASELLDLKLWMHTENHMAMVQVLRRAMDCIATFPEHRPKMAEVVKTLEEISAIYSKDQPSIESRLGDMVDGLLPKLTP